MGDLPTIRSPILPAMFRDRSGLFVCVYLWFLQELSSWSAGVPGFETIAPSTL
jgi:hypothetical protein